jgi:sigma-B regulation protein RsbU (phosphoserine phosphatase)
VAPNGKEALTLLSDDIGIVLLDLWMPEMDGMACLRYIRENFPEIPAIMITVSHEVSHAVAAMKYGAFDYVTKPFDPSELLVIVQQALRIRDQARRLRRAEAELDKAREHEISIASRIQQTLLLGAPLKDLRGVKVGELTIASKKIDGDFYDFHLISDTCFDVIVGDVMGKGIPAALLGAAAKQHLMSVLYRLMRGHRTGDPPEPGEIVSSVHAEMIGQMKDLETFFTLCYARFDLSNNVITYVDCGHMRTIHYHRRTGSCSLLQGENMPLGFPGQDRFTQVRAPFERGDLFFFYSDGLTEARDERGEFYGEERLVAFVRAHSTLEPQELCERVWKDVVDFSRRDTFTDDLTCVALRVEPTEQAKDGAREGSLTVPATLAELERVRGFLQEVCEGAGADVDEEQVKIVQIVATEIMTNIVRHAYQDKGGGEVRIEATASPGTIELDFFDQGIEFDFSKAPLPVFDGSKEGGFGLHIIAHTADSVQYTRDATGTNRARVTFTMQRRGEDEVQR